MIKNVLENIGGIGLYGIISLCLFFAFFTGMLIWAFRLRKPYLKSMEELPLDDSEALPQNQSKKLNS
jgi:hypothetical protein